MKNQYLFFLIKRISCARTYCNISKNLLFFKKFIYFSLSTYYYS